MKYKLFWRLFCIQIIESASIEEKLINVITVKIFKIMKVKEIYTVT